MKRYDSRMNGVDTSYERSVLYIREQYVDTLQNISLQHARVRQLEQWTIQAFMFDALM
jgi:hypothetical protein